MDTPNNAKRIAALLNAAANREEEAQALEARGSYLAAGQERSKGEELRNKAGSLIEKENRRRLGYMSAGELSSRCIAFR